MSVVCEDCDTAPAAWRDAQTGAIRCAACVIDRGAGRAHYAIQNSGDTSPPAADPMPPPPLGKSGRERVDEDRAALLRRWIASRENRARDMLLSVSGGHPNTPELTDEQLHDHARAIVDRSRVLYEEWKVGGGVIPQALSNAFIAWRIAYVAALKTLEPEEVADGK